jgi:hypothetical protein
MGFSRRNDQARDAVIRLTSAVEHIALLSHPAFWIVLAAVSELIGMSKLKSNSIIQLVLQALYAIKPGKP